MHKQLLPVSLVVSSLTLPAAAAVAAAGDADRFVRFADGARGSGTLVMTLKYSGDPSACAAHDVCGVSGTATVRVKLNADRGARLRGGTVVLPVRGSVTATVRDTVAGDVCHGRARVTSLGIGFKGDDAGLLLRIGTAPSAAAADDPFKTSCRAPSLRSLGDAALPTVRLKSIAAGVSQLKLSVNATRTADAHGYRTSLQTSGGLILRRPKG
jgi:hypothetical protein